MASISISGWSGSGGRTYTLTVTESSYNAKTNTSVVSWTLSASGGSSWYDYYLYASVNGTVVYNQSGSWSKGSFPAATGSTSGTMTISHGSDGKKTISFYIEGYAYTYSTYSNSGTLALTNLDRTAPTITAGTASNITVSGFQIPASANTTCSQWAYKIKKSGGSYGNWVYTTASSTSNTFTVSGLETNTSYVIQLAGKKSTNDVWGYSAEVTVKTLGASTITTAADILLGTDPVEIKWTPLNATFKFKIALAIGSWSWETADYIVPGSLTEQTFDSYTPALADIAPQILTSYVGVITATLTTYQDDGTQVGTPSTKTFNAEIPSTVKPSITEALLAEGTASGFGVFVKTLSTILGKVKAAGVYDSTIVSITMTVEGAVYAAELKTSGYYEATSVVLNTYGSLQVQIDVTDSRGGTVSQTLTATVYDYFLPFGTIELDVYGTTITTTVTGEIASVNNLNLKKLTITRRKLADDSTQTYTVNPLSSYDFSVTWTQTLADASTETYEYIAVIEDTLNTSADIEARTGITTLSLLGGGGGACFFGRAEEAGVWVQDADTGNRIRYDMTYAQALILAELLADPYNASSPKAYFEREFMEKDGAIYQAKEDIAAGASWNASKWTLIRGASS